MKKLFFVFIFIGFVLVGCSNKVELRHDSNYFVGMKYESVIEELSETGFTNVKTIPLNDLNESNHPMEGEVSEIIIQGDQNLNKNTKYDASSEIIIRYHTVKKTKLPISSESAKTTELEILIEIFEKSGFSVVTKEEMVDLDPDVYSSGFKNEAIIGEDLHVYEENQEVPFDSIIYITPHKVYDKYDVQLKLTFHENWIFSKYGVKLSFGGVNKSLDHGESLDQTFRLKEGKYELSISSSDLEYDASTKKDITVSGNMIIEAEMFCFASSIDLKINSIQNLSELLEGEIYPPSSSESYKGKKYDEVERELKKAGFTNIVTEAIYDISDSFTSEGVIESVSINGSTYFSKLMVFKTDSPVIIKYRMKKEHAPAGYTSPQTESENTNENTNNESENVNTSNNDTNSSTNVTNNVFYSTNDKDTVKNGNSGVYAYRSRGGSYYVYYIIDFDEGYVYTFSEGNSNGICERIKIQSGDLNSYILITYHDGNDTWDNALHFKWVRQPDHLVVQDSYFFEYDFYYTDLSEALWYRDEKTIVDY